VLLCLSLGNIFNENHTSENDKQLRYLDFTSSDFASYVLIFLCNIISCFVNGIGSDFCPGLAFLPKLNYTLYLLYSFSILPIPAIHLYSKPGADPREGRGRLDSWWPKHRDARLIKSSFYQSQNAPKLAFLGSKLETLFWGGAQPPPQIPPHTQPSILVPTALDIEAYGASALGASICPPSHAVHPGPPPPRLRAYLKPMAALIVPLTVTLPSVCA